MVHDVTTFFLEPNYEVFRLGDSMTVVVGHLCSLRSYEEPGI